jgi:uncharacterized protein YcbK (DUF882 family)
MGDLTKNFSAHEFMCKCCGQPGVKHKLVLAVQLLRDLTGRKIRISSGYRCPKHNREVGGVENSRHVKGEAADIVIAGMSVEEMVKAAEQVKDFGGIGAYPSKGFIHVDIRSNKARWNG